MTTSTADVAGLERQRPEWQPWLAVVQEALRQAASSRWDRAVPDGMQARSDRPLIAERTVVLKPSAVRRLLERLIRVASAAGAPKMASLQAALDAQLDAIALFVASLRQDTHHVEEISAASGADPEAFQAVAALVPVPFLQACHRRYGDSIVESWVEGYCPVCAAWPAFAEVRGIERARFLRCGRCGAQWRAHALSCPYCGTGNHDELVALVPGSGHSRSTIDACTRCGGYVKTFTTLAGCAARSVLIEDLASVDLDLAALEQGYSRPPGTGYPLAVTVMEKRIGRSWFAWK